MAEGRDLYQPDFDFEGFDERKGWVKELLAKVKLLESDRDVLGKKVENLGKKVRSLEENCDGLGKKVENLGKKVESLEEENGFLQKVKSMDKDGNGLLEKVKSLEVDRDVMRDALSEMKGEVLIVKEKEDKMREDNKILQSQLKSEMSEVRKNNDDIRNAVGQIEGKQNECGKKTEEAEISLRKIMEEQEKERREMKNKIVSVIKEKKKIVRDTLVDKVKSVIIFGLKEEKIVRREQRERKEKESIKKVVEIVTEGDSTETLRAVEEFHRLGKFEENKYRPLKIKFATQVQAEEMINGAWRLAQVEECRNVWINRDLDEDERVQMKELVQEAKQKNRERSEEEKMQFYWKVRDWKLRKWYVRN